MEEADSTSALKQLPEVGVHKQKAMEQNDIHSVSKLFEYKPDRKDSNRYFHCIAKIENSEALLDSGYNGQLTISEQFQVEYPPYGLAPFDESQISGREIIIDAVNGKDAIIQIHFDANPSPNNGKLCIKNIDNQKNYMFNDYI